MTTSTDTAPQVEVPDSTESAKRSRRRLMSRVSIQSKLLVMLLADERAVGRGRGRHRLPVGAQFAASFGVRPADRDPAVAESRAADRDRGSEELAGGLLARVDGHRRRIEAFTAGFDQLAPPPSTRPNSSRSSTTTPSSSPRTRTSRPATTSTSTRCCRRRPRSGICRRTTPFRSATTTTTADWTRRSSSTTPATAAPWSAANARYNDFFREIVTRFDFEDALLLDTRGNVVYSAYKGVDLGTNILTGPYKGSELGDAYQKALDSNAVDYVGLTDFGDYQPADEPTAWFVSPVGPQGQRRRRAGAAIPDLEDQQADDDRRSLAGLRHGRDRRDVHRRPRRPDAIQFPAVPRGSRSLQARRHRSRHAAGRRARTRSGSTAPPWCSPWRPRPPSWRSRVSAAR